MVMSTTSRTVALAQVQAFMAGIQKHFPSGQFTLGGTVYTTQSLVQTLEGLENALVVLYAAHASVRDAVMALHEVEATVGPLMRHGKRFVLAAFATSPQELADFGMQPPRARRPLDSDKRAAATAKMRATRIARGTKGSKQKLSVKGNVAGVVVTPTTTRASSSPGASPSAPSTATK
jgi:hypothetical protein